MRRFASNTTISNFSLQQVGVQGGTGFAARTVVMHLSQQYVGDPIGDDSVGTATSTTISNGQQLVYSSSTVIATTVLSGGNEFVFSGGIARNTLVSGGKMFISSGGTLSGATINAGGTGILKDGATLSGSVTLGSGGTALVSGAVTDSGTLMASSASSLLKIDSSGVVNGAAVVVGHGLVDVLSGGTANVAFLATGSGGLIIADTSGSTAAFTGAVSGFGGVGHANHTQFIDLIGVAFSSGQITSSYTQVGSGGTLFVSSGGVEVAEIHLIGNYSSGNFHVTSGISGSVKITDPAVVNGGSVVSGPAQPFPGGGIDLPNIAFGAHTTLAYSQNNAGTGGTLTVSDGRHAAAIALLGNYMAGSFAVAADGHGGTLVTQAQTGTAPLLTHPRA